MLGFIRERSSLIPSLFSAFAGNAGYIRHTLLVQTGGIEELPDLLAQVGILHLHIHDGPDGEKVVKNSAYQYHQIDREEGLEDDVGIYRQTEYIGKDGDDGNNGGTVPEEAHQGKGNQEQRQERRLQDKGVGLRRGDGGECNLLGAQFQLEKDENGCDALSDIDFVLEIKEHQQSGYDYGGDIYKREGRRLGMQGKTAQGEHNGHDTHREKENKPLPAYDGRLPGMEKSR